MPNIDALSQDYRPARGGAHDAGGSAGAGGSGQSQGGAFTGGTANGGRSGNAGKGGSHSKGGTTGGSNASGTGGSSEAGQSGAHEGGEAGVTPGGGGEAGLGQGGAAEGGAPATGGTQSTGGTSTGGTQGEAGGGGAPPDLPCTDGCVLFDIPPSANFSQFFTINIDLANGVDLSDSVFTAHLRAVDFIGTSETIQLYASATNYAFWNNANATLPLSTLGSGGELTMDLTNTPGWDSTHTISFGFLVRGASMAVETQVLLEDITVAVKADATATPKVGPWLFTQPADVNENRAETIDAMFSTPNVIFANPYNAVSGARAIWVPPGTGQ